MSRIKQTFVNLVVSLFTILNVVKLEMVAPQEDVPYREYANNYLILTGVCFILIAICYSTGIVTKWIKTLLIINVGMYLVLVAKALFDIAETNKYLDWTYAGLFVIAAVWYFLKPTKTKEEP